MRALLINGARSVIRRSLHSSWIERRRQRGHFNVVVAALTNKMARTVWAALAKGQAFDQVNWNQTKRLLSEIVKLTIVS